MSESLVQSELNNINNVIENIKIKAAYENSQVWFLYLSNHKVKSLIDFDLLLYHLNFILIFKNILNMKINLNQPNGFPAMYAPDSSKYVDVNNPSTISFNL